MPDPIQEHLEHLRANRYSRATLTERERILRTLPHPTDLDRETTQQWWASRRYRDDGAERAPSSLSAEASHAREFWRWCRQVGHMDHNPADWLPKVRQSKTMAVSVTEADLHGIIEDAREPMRQMIALAAMAGLRSAEIAAVRWEDIDRTNGVLWVRGGKGGKDRSVPLSAGLLAELGTPGTGPIVGKHMTAKAVSTAIGRHMRANGVNMTAHKLRARYATRFIAATGDAVAAAEVLGHADLSSILRYAVASGDTMRRGAEAAGRIG